MLSKSVIKFRGFWKEEYVWCLTLFWETSNISEKLPRLFSIIPRWNQIWKQCNTSEIFNEASDFDPPMTNLFWYELDYRIDKRNTFDDAVPFNRIAFRMNKFKLVETSFYQNQYSPVIWRVSVMFQWNYWRN